MQKKSIDAHNNDGRHWIFYPPDQKLSKKWAFWRTITIATWRYKKLLTVFIQSCRDYRPAAVAVGPRVSTLFDSCDSSLPVMAASAV